MPSLVDYIVIKDSPFELMPGNSEDFFDFNLPSDYVAGTNLAKPILQFMVRGNLDDDYTFQIGFNDPQMLQSQSEVRYSFSNVPQNRIFSMHEAIDGSKLNPGANRIYFRKIGVNVKVGFSDVILWFQRSV